MNVVLMTVDCLRRDRCGIYDHHRNTTPTIDSLAREGYVFDNAFATGPITTESFPGILAGRLSAQTVAANRLSQKRIPTEKPTIATLCREAGYSTVATISNPRVGTHVDSDRGFDAFANLRRRADTKQSGRTRIGKDVIPDVQVGHRLMRIRERLQGFDAIPVRYLVPFIGFRIYQYATGWPSVQGKFVVDEFLDGLSDTETPFFAWTHLMDIHAPQHPETVNEGGLYTAGRLNQFHSHAYKISDNYDSRISARYDSTVRYIDQQVSRVKDWLMANDLWDETAVILTADHGDSLFDHGLYEHPTHYLRDELLHVPLIVRVPGAEGDRVGATFSLGWLHEMVADLGGINRGALPCRSSRADHFSPSEEESNPIVFADSISKRGHSVVVRHGTAKVVAHNGDIAQTTDPKITPAGAYDLTLDPKERKISEGSFPELERKAADLLIDPEDIVDDRAQTEVDDAVSDRLKQLGYTE